MNLSRVLIAGTAAAALAGCAGNGGNPMAGWFGIPKEGQQQTAQSGSIQQDGGMQQQASVSAASPELVRNVQQQLRAKGIDGGPVDGVWGEQTQQAVMQFQRQQRLQPTGQLDARTLAALGVMDGQTADGGQGTQQGGQQQQGGAASQSQSGQSSTSQ